MRQPLAARHAALEKLRRCLPWLVAGLPLLLAACEDDGASYSRGFVEHLRANARPGSAECVEREVRQRWPDEAALYAAANRPRAVRGETDVVNYALRVVAGVCPER